MKKYKTYKDSGIEWIGEIPSDWNIGSLKLFCDNVTDGSHHSPPTVERGKRYISVKDIGQNEILFDGCKQISDEEFELLERNGCRPEKGDILLTKDGTIGRAAIVGDDNDFVALSSLGIIRPNKEKFNSFFLRESLVSSLNVNQMFSLIQGSALTRITISIIKNLLIVVPPLEEQTQIANYLDQKTSEIDTLIAKKEQLIKLLEEERTAMINQAVTKGLDPNVPMKDSGIDWLGEIPEHWEEARIKNVANIIGRIGFRGYTTADLVQEGEGAISLSPSNIKNQKLILKKCTYLSWNKYHESPEIKIYPNDILLVKTGSTIGKVALVPKKTPEMTLNPQLVVLKNIEINSKFLYLIMVSDYFQAYFSVYSAGGSTPAISQEKINNFKITYPDLNEQKEIVDKAFKDELRIYRLMETINQEIKLLKEYKTALISEVVTGIIDVREEVLN